MNDFLDKVSDFLSKYPGLLPLVGLGLIILNLILQIFPAAGLLIAIFCCTWVLSSV